MSDKLITLMAERAGKASAKPWTPEPPVEGKVYCVCSGGGRDKSGEDFVIAVGFGAACVTAGGALIFVEREANEEDESSYATLAMVETVAAQHPALDWRINMHGPLSGREYQRQGDGHWVLIYRDEGFA